jgi:5-methylcytosine-specific restriction enzyme subunit McrC
MTVTKIPIQNIYYLLSYAWDKLAEKELIDIQPENLRETIDLLAKVLINGTHKLLKQGLEHGYITQMVDMAGIKGKLALSETLKKGSLRHAKTICIVDDYSVDIPNNQILKATLLNLLQMEGLGATFKREIKKILPKLPPIADISLTGGTFQLAKINRNFRIYGLLMAVAKFIFENTAPTETKGVSRFMDFRRDEDKMNQLFEAFLRNFYKKEQNEFNEVFAKEMMWQLEGSVSDKKFLPKMRTDITLQNKTRRMIIEAKFYKKTFADGRGDMPKIHSPHLYQLYSYLMQQETDDERSQTTTGILLYPTVEEEIHLRYQYKRHQILIKTINLNANWQDIHDTLLKLWD